MNNLVRFFKSKEEKEYYRVNYEIPIPQLHTYIWINDLPFRVEEIQYSPATKKDDYTMVDITVKQVDIDDDCNFVDIED
jgi:hypothetical protein